MNTTLPVRFSDLKKFAQSPAHYKASVESRFEQTRSMRIGTIVHQMVLGKRDGFPEVVVYEGAQRRGTEWDKFRQKHAGAEIVTLSEWNEAEPIAKAVQADAVASKYLAGRREVPLTWEDAGIKCQTGGIDIVGDGWIADLKTTQTSEPARFMKLAWNLSYHAQLAFYEIGANANGIDTSKGLYIIGVETDAPYCVTVLKLTDAVRDLGRKSCAIWLEKYRSCVENDFWPGYAQSVLDFELPGWMVEEEEVDGNS